LVFYSAASASADDALTIVVNRGIAPLKFEDESSRAAGLLPDLWRLWAEKTGAEIRFVLVDSFQESLKLVKEGKVDLHAGLFKNAERAVFLDYSSPVLEVEYYLFTHPDLKPMLSLDDVSGFFVPKQIPFFFPQERPVLVGGRSIKSVAIPALLFLSG